jgi:hypothetical protein
VHLRAAAIEVSLFQVVSIILRFLEGFVSFHDSAISLLKKLSLVFNALNQESLIAVQMFVDLSVSTSIPSEWRE